MRLESLLIEEILIYLCQELINKLLLHWICQRSAGDLILLISFSYELSLTSMRLNFDNCCLAKPTI